MDNRSTPNSEAVNRALDITISSIAEDENEDGTAKGDAGM